MKYFLFLDESGDHGLTNIDEQFPIFVLSGILISESNYKLMSAQLADIKKEFWGNKKVIIHSRDIRKCQNEFTILFDEEIKKNFYSKINDLITTQNYVIISSAINKDKYIKLYGRLSDDVYEISLSFIIERAVFYLDDFASNVNALNVIIEKRGSKEDQKLNDHFNSLLSRGTGFVKPIRIKNYNSNCKFQHKKEDVAGLQVADLIAYPIARYVLDPERANPAFDLLASKFYSKNKKRFGLKIFP